MSADRKSARCRTRILTDSDRKRNRKEVLANYKTRINIGHHHDRWMHGIEGSQSSSSVIHTRHERTTKVLCNIFSSDFCLNVKFSQNKSNRNGLHYKNI